MLHQADLYCLKLDKILIYNLATKKMKNKNIYFFIILIFNLAITVNCQNIKSIESNDSIQLTESYKQEDLPINDYLTSELQPVRDNFKRLNAIKKWAKIKKIKLLESTEGGEATYYFQNKNLEKIITHNFGETFQKLTEYYLKNGKLSFVFEKTLQYNRPIYYDSIAKKENHDTEEFDINKSEIIEERSYFNNGKLLHQINNQDCGAPFAEEYLLEEQKRILTAFEKLLKLEKTK